MDKENKENNKTTIVIKEIIPDDIFKCAILENYWL